MSTKIIPQISIKTCDSCSVVMDVNNSRKEGGLHVKQHALDMQNQPCADASIWLDLCDRCLRVVCVAINKATSTLVPKE